jgi:hypothetical protein
VFLRRIVNFDDLSPGHALEEIESVGIVGRQRVADKDENVTTAYRLLGFLPYLKDIGIIDREFWIPGRDHASMVRIGFVEIRIGKRVGRVKAQLAGRPYGQPIRVVRSEILLEMSTPVDGSVRFEDWDSGAE